ncbi:minor capsid protein [Streptomyces sp. DH12]|uniref:minor capsid protein n=1 Tax=Streptomyces sp. DH12 TaxID=2857010 RepID=UPI001E61FDF4|nr:minor capsid protein [Streptomyces sp. DH12]
MTQYTRWRPGDARRQWTTRGRRLASEGLQRGLEHVLAESKKLVPLDEGTLERSGRVNVSGLEGVVSYDTVYAVRQHEELTWKHAPGRQAKYLEQPMNSERDVVLRLMAVSVRRWLRG